MLNPPFRFEAMWTKEEGSKGLVDNAWQVEVKGSHGFHLANKLERTKKNLKKWIGRFSALSGRELSRFKLTLPRFNKNPPQNKT